MKRSIEYHSNVQNTICLSVHVCESECVSVHTQHVCLHKFLRAKKHLIDTAHLREYGVCVGVI